MISDRKTKREKLAEFFDIVSDQIRVDLMAKIIEEPSIDINNLDYSEIKLNHIHLPKLDKYNLIKPKDGQNDLYDANKFEYNQENNLIGESPNKIDQKRFLDILNFYQDGDNFLDSEQIRTLSNPLHLCVLEQAERKEQKIGFDELVDFLSEKRFDNAQDPEETAMIYMKHSGLPKLDNSDLIRLDSEGRQIQTSEDYTNSDFSVIDYLESLNYQGI